MVHPIKENFSQSDIEQIQNEGLTLNDIYHQIEIFKKGIAPIKINRPCTIGDGIHIIDEKQSKRFLDLHQQASHNGRLMKFVPASGAASRMFKDWYKYLDQKAFDSLHESTVFLENLYRYPFYPDLSAVVERKGHKIENLIRDRKYMDLLNYIVNAGGLDCGRLPKALLKFHLYPDGSIRTPIEEHLVEAALYTKDASNTCRLHFTISDIHKDDISAYLTSIKRGFEKKLGVRYEVELSIQLPSTDTIAVDMLDQPFRGETGRLTFRPGGHGALLKNLQAVAGDIVYIKNIDNVAPDRLKANAIYYKKMMCGYLIALQDKAFQGLRLLCDADIKEKDILFLVDFCSVNLNIVFPTQFRSYSLQDRRKFLFKKLNRPIRICGMVKNEGEPGGGPYWVDEADGTQSLQIVEEFQVDPNSESQRNLWKSGTHFNPVDIVCGLKNFRGETFKLDQFVNMKAMSIAKKSEKGRDLKALELPGLWNGSMSSWNTVFVEIPIETFNPVKTIDDLLRPSHQPQ